MKQLFTTTLLACSILLTTNALLAQTSPEKSVDAPNENTLQAIADSLLETEIEMVIFMLPADDPATITKPDQELEQIYIKPQPQPQPKPADETSHKTRSPKLAHTDGADWEPEAMIPSVHGLVHQLINYGLHYRQEDNRQLDISGNPLAH